MTYAANIHTLRQARSMSMERSVVTTTCFVWRLSPFAGPGGAHPCARAPRLGDDPKQARERPCSARRARGRHRAAGRRRSLPTALNIARGRDTGLEFLEG